MSEEIDRLIQNKINDVTINYEQLCNYFKEIKFNEVITKYINKVKNGTENEKLEHVLIKVFLDNKEFLKSISYCTSMLLSIGSKNNLSPKDGDIRIIDGFADLSRFGSVSKIIEYEDEFSYDYEDHRNGWYSGGKYTFKALNINTEVKNDKFFIITLGEMKMIKDWDFKRIDDIYINRSLG
ncbi:hypothetical protein [Clostridium estertheticum]|uniref:hypothetical protein n=1 Tax=Clostridium estertheticum TaxID=238834 RepID=UPI001C0B00A7|nr:hypothetical protein [Clostridium estertheticum]MBU3172484.1 hypothetical protein [Clostridium estertheticum]